MDNTEHTYRLSFSWWIGNLAISSFILFIVIGTLIFNFQELISGKLGIADYLGFIFVIFVMFPFGLLLFSTPLITKLVVYSHGIEYHTPVFILRADWKELINNGHVKNKKAGKSMVVVPKGGALTLRKWALPFRKILRHDPKDIQILVSQFGTSNGNSFEADILVNLSQRGQFSATE